MGFLQGWPPEALIALATLSVTNIVAAVQIVLKWRESSDTGRLRLHEMGWQEAKIRGEQVELLRRLLDRGRRRENALATGFEVLILQMPEDLSPAQLRAVTRARALFEGALLQASSEQVSST